MGKTFVFIVAVVITVILLLAAIFLGFMATGDDKENRIISVSVCSALIVVTWLCVYF